MSSGNSMNGLLQEHCKHHPDRAACWVKGRSGWEEVTWQEWQDHSIRLALWLEEQGVTSESAVLLQAENRFFWMLVYSAVERLGATCISAPPHLEPDVLRECVIGADVNVAFVEGPAQIDALSIGGEPRAPLKSVVYFSARSELRDGDELLLDQVLGWPVDERIASYDELVEITLPEVEAGEEAQALDAAGSDGGATVMFSAGTHGRISSFYAPLDADMEQAAALADALDLSKDDVVMVALPLWHVSGRVLSLACMAAGVVTVFVEENDRLLDEMQAIHPTIVATRAHLFERLYSRITADAGTANPLRKAVFNWAMSAGKAASHLREEREPRGAWLSAQLAVANQLVFKSLHELFGRRLKYFFAAGGVVLESAARFFDSAGVLILESYTTTRTGYTHVNRPDDYRFGSAGQALEGVQAFEVDGELELSAPWLPSSWSAADGAEAPLKRVRTGDLGREDDGWLVIDGRTNELVELSSGQTVLVGRLERALRSAPLIEHAVVLGAGRPFLSALITLDVESVKRWGEEHGVEGNFSELSQNRQIFEMVNALVEETNASRPSHEQIKKFAVLERRLSRRRDELTPLLDVERDVVEDHFEGIIGSFYDSQF